MTTTPQYGPNTAAVERMLERLRRAAGEELRRLAEAKAAAGVAEWEAARDAAWEAFWDVASSKRADQDGYWDGVAWDGAWPSAWLATFAIIMGDLLSPEHIADLTGPWRETFGPTWEEQA